LEVKTIASSTAFLERSDPQAEPGGDHVVSKIYMAQGAWLRAQGKKKHH
jgi:hypothetical protein